MSNNKLWTTYYREAKYLLRKESIKLANNFEFKDDTYVHIDNEFEQIQACPGMYISSKGSEGALHLFKEIATNSIDEANNIESPCDEIDIAFDEANQHFIVSDNGRGIPFPEMINVCTKKHTSTKIYNRANNIYSAGCNGVGIKVTIAFSHLFSLESYRGKESKLLKFVDCKMEDNDPIKLKKPQHGLVVNFIPSQEQLGPTSVKSDDCLEWLRHMSYIINDKIKINYFEINNGERKIIRTFTHQGLEKNVEYLSPSLAFDPISVKYSEGIVMKDQMGNDMNDPYELNLSMSFSYDKSIDEEVIDSYANMVWTFGGGTHVNACRSALCDFMVKAARNADPDSKYPVTIQDVRKGLVLCVHCNWDAIVFGGQHKSTVTNDDIEDIGKKGSLKALSDFFADNNALLNKLIAYYRQMAKIRLEAYKIKGIKPPKAMSVYDEAEIRGFTPVADSNRKGYKELIITEGESAAGAIIAARNPYYQAVYHTQGVMTNCADLPLKKVMESRVPRDLARILGVEPGKNFDINNLRYNKIIFLQDADADGKNIRSLASTYLIVWMPQLIEEGRLYAGVPPLYTLSDKAMKKYGVSKGFLFDKHEYFRLFSDIIAKNIELFIVDSDEKSLIPQSKSQIKLFLEMNRKYLDLLEQLSLTREACDTRVIEIVCNAIVRFGIDSDKMIEYLKINLPEMKYDKDTKALVGSYETIHNGLIIDEGFMDFAKEFLEIFEQNPSMFVVYKNKNDKEDSPIRTTIGEFLKDILNRYDIDVSQRFKGLGEAESKLLFWTTLNPKVRKLIRLTMEDRERVLDTVAALHGSGPKNAEKRRDLLDRAEITDDDIDN